MCGCSLIVRALVFVMAVLATHAQAQDIGVWTRVGATVGAPVPVGDIPEGAEGSPVVGLVAGGYIDWPFNSRWSLLSEIQFVYYGGLFSTPLKNNPYVDRVHIVTPDGTRAIYEVNTVFTGTATGTFANYYIQFPLLVAWRFAERWRIASGPYVGVLLDTKSYATGVGQVGIRPETVEKSMYFEAEIRDIDYGVILGVQYEPFDDISIDLRGALGLTSIFNSDFASVDRLVQNVYIHTSFAFRVF